MPNPNPNTTSKRVVLIVVLAGRVVSLALAAFVSPFASSHPDGLEWVAEEEGFLHKAEEAEVAWEGSPMPDYEIPAVRGPASGPLAGVIGTLITFIAGMGLVWVVRHRRQDPPSGGDDA